MTSGLGNEILASSDDAKLQQEGLASPRSPEGTRRIHKRRLFSRRNSENDDIPLEVPMDSPQAADAFATIPDSLISYATLIYLGFSEQRADALWDEWTSWPTRGPDPTRETDADGGRFIMEFLDFVTGVFDNGPNATGENDDEWVDCLTTYGISNDVRTAIMDPIFGYLRQSQSCAFWAKDTIEMRFAGLQDIQRASRERAREIQRDSLRSGSSSQPSQQSHRSVSDIQRAAATGIVQSSTATAHRMAHGHAPGMTVLFKGCDLARVNGLLDAEGNLLNLGTILSSPPSDFSGTRAMFYFTADYKIAEYYASYAKRRANCEAVVIIRVEIPNVAIESLTAPEVQRLWWPSDEWKELVWRCRTQQSLPRNLKKFRQANLIIGNISRKPDSAYHSLDDWHQLSERYLLKTDDPNDPTNAVQFVFSGEEEGREFLMENCRHSVTVVPYRRDDMDRHISARTEALDELRRQISEGFSDELS